MITNLFYLPGNPVERPIFDYLADRLVELCLRIGNSEECAEKWLMALGTNYRSPTRHYHTLGRIYYILQVMDDKLPETEDPDLFETAIWFHNFSYSPGSIIDPRTTSINNQFATQFADQTALMSRTGDMCALIRASAHYLNIPTPSPRERLFLELILHQLGASPATYNLYVNACRREYPGLTDLQFRAMRKVYLNQLLRSFLITERTTGFDQNRNFALENVRKELELYS